MATIFVYISFHKLDNSISTMSISGTMQNNQRQCTQVCSVCFGNIEKTSSYSHTLLGTHQMLGLLLLFRYAEGLLCTRLRNKEHFRYWILTRIVCMGFRKMVKHAVA